jgi:RNA polymerase sigma-70 factor, ECF subfamily
VTRVGCSEVDTVAPITAQPQQPAENGTDRGDTELVRRAQAGDRQALEELLRTHYDRLHAVCRRMTGHSADAADAAQNALLAITRGLSGFDHRSRFSSWVYRIAVNCSIDEVRRRARTQAASLDEWAELPATDRSGGHPGGGRAWAVDGSGWIGSREEGDPERSAERLDIDSALRSLPVEFRGPVVLRDLCGLDYAEIAEALQLPPGTVRSRIARGRAALVRLLEPTRSRP